MPFSILQDKTQGNYDDPLPPAHMGVVHTLTNCTAQASSIHQATEAHHQSHTVPLLQVDPDYNQLERVRFLAWGPPTQIHSSKLLTRQGQAMIVSPPAKTSQGLG